MTYYAWSTMACVVFNLTTSLSSVRPTSLLVSEWRFSLSSAIVENMSISCSDRVLMLLDPSLSRNYLNFWFLFAFPPNEKFSYDSNLLLFDSNDGSLSFILLKVRSNNRR